MSGPVSLMMFSLIVVHGHGMLQAFFRLFLYLCNHITHVLSCLSDKYSLCLHGHGMLQVFLPLFLPLQSHHSCLVVSL